MQFDASGADVSGADVSGLSRCDGIAGLGPLTHAHPMPGADHPSDGPARAAFETAEIRDLRVELDRLRAERERLLDTQRRVMELLHTLSPEKILHDLRNVLNERELYRALAEIDSLPD